MGEIVNIYRSAKTLLSIAALVIFLSVPSAGEAQEKTVPANRAQVQFSYAPLVREAAPAVVNIYTAKTVNVRRFAPLFNDPFFQQFFGGQLNRTLPGQQKKVQNSLGSGVIVSKDGVIVTNHHVIEGAEEIKVVLSDRREFEAKIVGSDERTDIAVLKIDGGSRGFSFIEMNNSDNLEVGDLVLAIGNPFGVGQTVTSGIVSALARTQVGVSDLGSFIQTDAAINPGNSGGALLGMDGKLVGINTAIFSKSGGSMGIGFAIPSNMVSTVVKSIQSGGRAVRPWFGAAGQSVSAEIAQNVGLPNPQGVMITNIFSASPAMRAGIKRGDIIMTISGHEIQTPQDLRFRIATLSPGGTVKVGIWRGGQKISADLMLEVPPENPPRNETLLKGPNPVSGAVVANLSPALVDELGLPMHNVTGVIITKISRNSNAASFGFAPGDILKEINGQSISTVVDVVRTLAKNTRLWRITINRGGRELSMAIKS
ncbi:MAG: DegQ family serine endoprotease [Rhodospirillaceae bacterium]|nr:DegQ family serine endoprotease [Rhodospirillaceae bacterium]